MMPSALVRKLNDDESGLDDLVNCIVRMIQNAGLERVYNRVHLYNYINTAGRDLSGVVPTGRLFGSESKCKKGGLQLSLQLHQIAQGITVQVQTASLEAQLDLQGKIPGLKN
jgi:hypothetical protein